MTRQEYIALYKEWKNIEPSFVPSLFGPEKDILTSLNTCYAEAQEALQRRLQRKGTKKLKPLSIQNQFDAEVMPLLYEWFREDLKELVQRQAEVKKRLYSAEIDDCSALPDVWNLVKKSTTSDFGSQTSPNTYARGALKIHEDALQRAGIEYKVVCYKVRESSTDSYGHFLDPFCEYQLWAPIEPELLAYIYATFGRDSLEVNRENNLNNAVLHPLDQRVPF